MSDSRPDSLNLRALSYLQDELDPAERQAFEEQLAQDQEAREALEDAVWIAGATAAELASPAAAGPVPQRGWRWVAAAAGLLLAAWLGYLLWLAPGQAEGDLDALVFDGIDAPGMENLYAAYEAEASLEEAEDPLQDLLSAEADETPRIPGWMMEGLAR